MRTAGGIEGTYSACMQCCFLLLACRLLAAQNKAVAVVWPFPGWLCLANSDPSCPDADLPVQCWLVWPISATELDCCVLDTATGRPSSGQFPEQSKNQLTLWQRSTLHDANLLAVAGEFLEYTNAARCSSPATHTAGKKGGANHCPANSCTAARAGGSLTSRLYRSGLQCKLKHIAGRIELYTDDQPLWSSSSIPVSLSKVPP
jgi:hypothetical protein